MDKGGGSNLKAVHYSTMRHYLIILTTQRSRSRYLVARRPKASSVLPNEIMLETSIKVTVGRFVSRDPELVTFLSTIVQSLRLVELLRSQARNIVAMVDEVCAEALVFVGDSVLANIWQTE